MKAFFIDRYGKQNGTIGDLPDPAVGIHDVLIQVHAASVNPLDAKIRTGEFKLLLPYSFPLVLGNDLAGVVMSVGSAVTHFKPGDEVYARPPEARIGTFAERIAVNENALALKPANLSMAEAASLPLPKQYGQVLGDLLDRIEASALFSGESCSFSQQDLFDNLQLWADKARAKLASP